jgi:spore germination cell wall hydrolase CwlJ-like protein
MKNIVILIALAASVFSGEKEQRIIALTILGEARGEGTGGMYAVGCVIQERARESNLTPAKVCHAPYQFSVWNAGKGKIKKESELSDLWKSKSAPYAKTLALAIDSGYDLAQTFTGNADHYYSKKMMKSPPSWAYKIDKRTGKFLRDKEGNKISVKPTKVIGNHVFYNLR